MRSGQTVTVAPPTTGDHGGAAAVCLLRGSAVIPADRATQPRGHRVPGAGRRAEIRSFNQRSFPGPALAYAGRANASLDANRTLAALREQIEVILAKAEPAEDAPRIPTRDHRRQRRVETDLRHRQPVQALASHHVLTPTAGSPTSAHLLPGCINPTGPGNAPVSAYDLVCSVTYGFMPRARLGHHDIAASPPCGVWTMRSLSR